MKSLKIFYLFFFALFIFGWAEENLDEKVKLFLQENRYLWRDENISETDGKILFGIIVENNYKSALEIGTSTGHSAIWIAWALSKTGGKLITIEINEERYKKAISNFKKAGLSDFIIPILGDAHDLVYKMEGPFDFIFIDADKDWYKNYAMALIPKLRAGGCLTAHNVLNRFMRGVRDFLDYIYSLPYMETRIDNSTRSGISISYKKAENK